MKTTIAMNYKQAIWGFLLIAAGIIWIAGNLGVVTFSWSALISMWPVLLILWGVSALPLKGGWKALLSFIIIAGALSYSIKDDKGKNLWGKRVESGVNIHFNKKDFSQKGASGDLSYQRELIQMPQGFNHAVLKLDGAAGRFNISDTSARYLADFQKKGEQGEYSVSPYKEDQTYVVDVTMNKVTGWHREGGGVANIRLSPQPQWSLLLNLGAAQANLELSDFKVKEVAVKGGASGIDMTLGTRYPKVNVDIEAGASSIVLRIPEEAGCRVQMKTVLAGKELDGFVREERNLYYTPGFASKDVQIRVNVRAAVANFKVERY